VKGNVPYAIFFCSEEAARFAGEGSAEVVSYRKEFKRPLPATPFENPAVTKAVKESGLSLVKVPATPANAELARKYNLTGAPALVICAPNGEALTMLGGSQFTMATILATLKTIREDYAAWKRAHPAGK
jgi:hypothetical protein